MTIKPSDVLRNAAVRIENRDCVGCCAAIHWQNGVSNKVKNRAFNLFASLYKPAKWQMWWFHSGGQDDATPECQTHRIIALLLTADMAESVGE